MGQPLVANGYWNFTVYGHDNIRILIELLNGKLVLAKTNLRFKELWVDNYNRLFPDQAIVYKGPGFLSSAQEWGSLWLPLSSLSSPMPG